MKRAIIIAATILFAVAPVTRAADAKPATPRPLAWLGMGYTWMDNKDGRKFLVVQKLSPDGPALKAGLRPGDILTTVNGQRVDFGDDLEFLLFLTERVPGERLTFGGVREGRDVKVTVVLGALPEAARAAWDHNFEMARRKRLASSNPK